MFKIIYFSAIIFQFKYKWVNIGQTLSKKKMLMSWSRTNNFYQIHSPPSAYGVVNQVEFKNFAYFAMFKRIHVEYLKSGEIYVILDSTGFNMDKIRDALNHFFDHDDYAKFYGGYKFYIPFISMDKFNKLVNFFKLINTTYTQEEFPRELIFELEQIFTYIFSPEKLKNKIPEHTISEYELPNKHTNPALKNSSALINTWSIRAFDISRFKKLLAHGEDPDQTHPIETEKTCLYWAIAAENLQVVQLLICYGANPFKRFGLQFISAVEFAKELKQITILNILFSAATNPKKSLALEVTQSAIYNQNKEIISWFNFSNKQAIYTLIKSIDKVSIYEKSSLFALFKSFFNAADLSRTTTEAIFNQEFTSDKHKFVEMIYTRNHELIGFRLFEFFTLETRKQHLVSHCIYGLLKPEYRSYGIMTLLSFRPAFSLQLLAPDYTIVIYMSALEKFSYRTIKDYLHGPKYQSAYVSQLLDEVLLQVYDKQIKLFHKGDMTCYATESEPIIVKTPPNLVNDIHDEFYYKDILGYTDNKIDPKDPRFAPVIFMVDEDSFERMLHSSAKLGVAFSPHVKQLAKSFKPFFPELIGKQLGKSFKGYANSPHLFFLENKLQTSVKTDKQEVFSYYNGKL